MKSLTLTLLALCSFLFSFISVDDIGPEVTKKKLELPAFNSIYVNSNYTVYLKQTNKQAVEVEALSEIYAISEFKVEDGIFHINIKRKKDSANKSLWSKIDDIKIAPTLKVYVSMKDVHELRVNGAGKIVSENSIASSDLELGVSGSGDIDIDIKGNELKTNLSGSGNIKLKGYASELKANVSGAGSLHAFECELEKAEATVSGPGNCEINVSDNLEATVYGSGSLKHKGTTKTVVKKEYGSGEISRAY